MIGLSLAGGMEAELRAVMGRFAALPRHIARKHLQAAMRRAIKDGVPSLRAATPPIGVRRGRLRRGERRTTGALRRSVTTRAKYVDRPGGAGAVYGVLGYKAGIESRKAIWLQFGTNRVQPRRMIENFTRQYGGPALATLKAEMVSGLEKAAKELAAGKNPGRAG